MKKMIKFLLIISLLTVAGLFMLACNDSIPGGSTGGNKDENSGGTTGSAAGGTIRIVNNYMLIQTFEIIFDPGPDEIIEWSSEIPGKEIMDVKVSNNGIYGIYIIVGEQRYGFTSTIESGSTRTFIFNP